MCRPCVGPQDLAITAFKEHAASWENQTLDESVICMVKGVGALRNRMKPDPETPRRLSQRKCH